MKDMVAALSAISRRAGDAILEVYDREDFGIETKDDDSPLTKADLASHDIIVGALAEAFPDVPVLSEEDADISFEERGKWSRYFLVDPLDGTKEFISRNGEFTVNIALIEHGVPVAGVVYVPVKRVLYGGLNGEDKFAFKVEGDVEREIKVRQLEERLQNGEPLTVVASRRHGGENLAKCLSVLDDAFGEVESRNMGSSLKLCLVAEGEADIYPRLAPTSEWDTAAAQAVVEAAGGKVVDVALERLRYNTKPALLNPFFYVLGDPDFDWDSILSRVDVTPV